MRKYRKYLMMFLLVGILGAPMVAQADTYDFGFYFKDVTTTEYTSINKKSDNDQYWYITFNSPYSTMNSKNIFGCKMHRSGNDNVDVYHTFTNHVIKYPIKYQVTVKENDAMYMAAKKDNSSLSSEALNVSGRFAP